MGSIFGKAKKENPESGNRRQQTQQAPNKKNGGSAAAVEITSKDRAVLDLKNARDKLRRYRGQLEKDSQKLEGQVKTLIALKQKNRALLLLKLKKVKENELETLDAKLMNVYSMIQSVEWASINVSVIAAIESGNIAYTTFVINTQLTNDAKFSFFQFNSTYQYTTNLTPLNRTIPYHTIPRYL